jgi:hypothetical protein
MKCLLVALKRIERLRLVGDDMRLGLAIAGHRQMHVHPPQLRRIETDIEMAVAFFRFRRNARGQRRDIQYRDR